MRDGSLTAIQKNALLEVSNIIRTKFNEVSSLVTTNLNCFPDPAGLSTVNLNSSLKDRAVTSGWFGKALKKIINATATIFVAIVTQTVLGAVEGVGAAITEGGLAGIFLAPVGLVVGAGIGYLSGVIKGIADAVTGKYVCVFPGVGNCSQ